MISTSVLVSPGSVEFVETNHPALYWSHGKNKLCISYMLDAKIKAGFPCSGDDVLGALVFGQFAVDVGGVVGDWPPSLPERDPLEKKYGNQV